MHSIDTVKTRLQGQIITRTRKYTGMTQSIRMIFAQEGLRGLYGGFTAAASGSILSTTIYFTFYESLKRRFINDHVNPTFTYFISGIILWNG